MDRNVQKSEYPQTEAILGLGGMGRIEKSVFISYRRNDVSWARYRTAFAILASVVAAAIGLMMAFRDVPKLAAPQNSPPRVETPRLILAGFVQDDHGDPLPNVRVVLPELNVETATDSRGRFSFTGLSNAAASIRLIARKPCFQTWTADAPIGDSGFSFVLRRVPCDSSQ